MALSELAGAETPARKTSRVLAISPMPPEKSAYALARYSRSPDSIRDSIEWVRTHDSSKFLESFYFQYGHASIADLGHLVLCFEGVSELAAIEIEDEQLWDGQARSSRYQDFSKSGFVVPPGDFDHATYSAAARRLLDGYNAIHQRMIEFLSDKLPRPDDMKPDMYKRNIAARAFDVARYVLFLGIPTGVGQVTSIRTLERQIRRLKTSEFRELREIAAEMADACTSPAACAWDASSSGEPIAPTLARHVDPDVYAANSSRDLAQWAAQNLSFHTPASVETVHVVRSIDTHADIAATLLYPVTDRPYHELYDLVCGWSAAQRDEVIDVALRSRTTRDELSRAFRGGMYAFDILMDIGAYRDLHRHRRCQQFRQPYTTALGYDVPASLSEAGLQPMYDALISDNSSAISEIGSSAAQYLLPFATRSRFLFKMDFAEAEYIARLRSGVKGHFSYRNIAWEMKRAMETIEPSLARLMEATPPWIEDPLKR
jgi:thymidylate synthase ThyX